MRYAKAAVAVVTVILLAVVAATEGINLSDGISGAEWVAVIVGFANAVGVYAVRNTPYP